MTPESRSPCVALAVQGGGAHGAFAWGVLDRLLHDGLAVDRICGVSSGAITAVALAQGWARGGAAGARAQMALLWRRIGEAAAFSPLQNSPMERWLFGDDMRNNFAWQGVEAAMRLFSPAQLNPFGHHPLRGLLGDLLDRAALADPAAPAVTVAATNVETGEAALFGNEAITIEALLATICLPFVFPAVEIEGRPHWDGGYAGNPPLGPLLQPGPPNRLLLVRAQPRRRAGVPTTQAEILNRLNEIACHSLIEAELAALPAGIDLVSYDADAALARLPISTKLTADAHLIRQLHDLGWAAAASEAMAAD